MIPALILNRSSNLPRRMLKMKENYRRRYGKNQLKRRSTAKAQSYFERSNLVDKEVVNDVYSTIGVKAIHNFNLGISRELERCIYQRLGSNEVTKSLL